MKTPVIAMGAVMREVNDGRVGPSGVGTLAGTPGEIGELLRRSGVERAMALTFTHESERTVRVIADALGSLAPMVAGLIKWRRREAPDKIVDVLVPTVPTPERMTAHARSEALASGDWPTAALVAELAGFSTTNLSARPNKWKKEGQVFAIRHQGLDYFAAYGLDAEAGYRSLKSLAPILAVWTLAVWTCQSPPHRPSLARRRSNHHGFGALNSHPWRSPRFPPSRLVRHPPSVWGGSMRVCVRRAGVPQP